MTNEQLLFVSCANEKYYKFVIPFVYSIFKTQPGASIEIFLESKNKFLENNIEAIDIIKRKMSDNLILSERSFDGIKPNTVRFVNEPYTKKDYVYISDVDIFFTEENIINFHLEKMKETRQNFSNIVRKGTRRLTGLHFTKWDALYPIPNQIAAGNRNDEAVLYDIVLRKTGLNPNASLPIDQYRPVHGIHSSPNREILGNGGQLSWGINLSRAQRWLELTETEEWIELYPTLMKRYKTVADSITRYANDLNT